jgi:peptidoglycan/xylan/chitin deacetylase (PgdA/CDA1 family)
VSAVNPALAALVKRTLLGAGHYPRRLRRDAFPGVAVLCYHAIRADDWPPGMMQFEDLHVRAGELESHCRLVRDTCHPISLDQWRAARAGGPALPPRPVLFTFDDGYRSVFTVARPILARYQIPAVAFVCSDPVEPQHLLWYDAVAREHGEAAAERIKTLPFAQWQAQAAGLRRPAGAADPHAPLTRAQIRALADGAMEIGGHTAGHPILARAPASEQRAEILRNKAALESWIGRPVRAFAYPNGRPGLDYTSETVDLIEESGFDFAFTTHAGFSTPAERWLECSRFVMVAGIEPAELGHRLSYSWRR